MTAVLKYPKIIDNVTSYLHKDELSFALPGKIREDLSVNRNGEIAYRTQFSNVGYTKHKSNFWIKTIDHLGWTRDQLSMSLLFLNFTIPTIRSECFVWYNFIF